MDSDDPTGLAGKGGSPPDVEQQQQLPLATVQAARSTRPKNHTHRRPALNYVGGR